MYLKTALNNIKRSPFQAIAAILVLAVTFFVATMIVILTYGSSRLVTYFETRPQVIAFLKTDASPQAIDALKAHLEKDERIRDVKFVSKEEALTIYKSATSDNPLLGELVSPSIFPASLEFSVKDLQSAASVIDGVKSEGIVDSVGFTASLGNNSSMKSLLDKLSKVVYYIRMGGIVLVSVLGLTSFLVLLIVISMRIAGRRSEVETLKLIGATGGFIRAPIVMESVVYAFIGVFLGWVLALILVLYSAPSIVSYFGAVEVIPRQSLVFFEFMLLILGGELLVGFVIALAGSLLAVGRALAER